MHRAAGAGFKSVVDALLAAKADVNARNERGWTPLHSAAEQGFKSVAEALLADKADVNARIKRGVRVLALQHELIDARREIQQLRSALPHARPPALPPPFLRAVPLAAGTIGR